MLCHEKSGNPVLTKKVSPWILSFEIPQIRFFVTAGKKMFRVSKNELFFAGIEPMYTYNGHKSFA
jgi:hypothetical protein